MKCLLSKEINSCEHCDLEHMTCKNPKVGCSFQEKIIKEAKKSVIIKKPYVREERWYEKYYRKE